MGPLHELDLIKLVQAIQATHMCAPAARFATEARRVADAFHRQRGLFEDLVAEEISDGHLSRRDQVEIIRLRMVHLPFLVGQLARGRGGSGVDE